MPDTHEPPELTGDVRGGRANGELDRLRGTEARWRRSRVRSEATLALGASGMLSTLFLSFWALQSWGYSYLPFIAVVVVAAVVAGLPSLELIRRGVNGVRNPLAVPPAAQRGELESGPEGKPPERQLLEAIQRNGDITPARAALETNLTVEEAERILSRLAEGGHLDVRVEGGRLVYSL